jgi:two-component system, OmpR family, sensor kinase
MWSPRALKRLSIRLRVTLAFTGVMAVVLSFVGVFLYLHFKTGLDTGIDDGLKARAVDVSGVARQARSGRVDLRRLLDQPGEGFAQIIDVHRGVVRSSPDVHGRSLLSSSELTEAAHKRLTLDRGEKFRLLAEPADRSGDVVVVVGQSLKQREKALEQFSGALFVGAPLALLLASLAGYGLAAAALRPVESMRQRAGTISAAEAGARLPLPEPRDELYRLGSTLNEMLARLEAALARERAFVSDASHELRTPLSILRAELELALRDGQSAADFETAIRSAAEETERLSKLAEDLLVIARSEQGDLPVRKREVELRDVLSGVAARFAVRARSEHRSIEVEDTSAVRANADAERLEQALANLVDNALRHGDGCVTLSALRRNGTVEVHVTDQGVGFPTQFLPRAFDRFSRAQRGRSEGGTGLGLAIVDAIARAHGGGARAANLPSGGADVWLSLPSRTRQE